MCDFSLVIYLCPNYCTTRSLEPSLIILVLGKATPPQSIQRGVGLHLLPNHTQPPEGICFAHANQILGRVGELRDPLLNPMRRKISKTGTAGDGVTR